jgi:phosphomevalonate kinase
MKTFAPGKLVITGAYAVLEGAPAIVVATSRGAFADGARTALEATPEVRAAIGDAPAPHVDASSMFAGARKLGLGASAAILVASLAAREAEKGRDLSSSALRDGLFERARAAHAEAQNGGSGVDIAASVYGGILRYTLSSRTRVTLPAKTRLTVLACPTSARTAELRSQVDALASSNAVVHAACMKELSTIAVEAASAIDRTDHDAFVAAVRRTLRALARLGAASGAPIVPAGFDVLSDLAAKEAAALCVAGAGGGDVAAFVGHDVPSPAFLERAHAFGMFPLELEIDEKGVRTASQTLAMNAGATMRASSLRQ